MPDDVCTIDVPCQISAIKTNILRLFDRTDDIDTEIINIHTEIDALDARIDALESGEVGAFTFVDTEAELNAALLIGGTIFITALIPLASPVKIVGKNNTKLIGFPLDENPVGCSLAFIAGNDGPFGWDMFRVTGVSCRFQGLKLTTNHPLTSNFASLGAAVAFYGSLTDPIAADLVIDDCEIYNVGIGVFHSTAPTAVKSSRVKITNSYIHSFVNGGLHLDGAMEELTIDNNVIKGRAPGEVHSTISNGGGVTWGNAMFIANNNEKVIISRNKVSDVDRHAIELYNAVVSGTKQCQIINNVCNDCCFGISCSANESLLIDGNTLLRCKALGIELTGLPSSTAKYVVVNNSIDDTRYHPILQAAITPTVGISVDGVVSSTLITKNHIGKITSPVGNGEAIGIQLFNGGKNVTISGNKLYDAGNRMIWVNGNGIDVYTIINIEHNTFVYSPDYLTIYAGPTFTYWPAMHYNNVGVMVVRFNTSLAPSAFAIAVGFASVEGTGKVYVGDSYENPVDVANGDLAVRGSNIRATY